MDTTFIQFFLYLNLFLLGGLVALAAQFAYAHFKKPEETPKSQPALPRTVKDRILSSAAKKFEATLEHTAGDLEDDLGDTSKQLSALLKRFGSTILDDEMKLFRKHLDEIRENTEKTVGGASLKVAEQQTDIEAKLAARQAEFDAKLIALQAELEQTLVGRQTELDTVLMDRKKKLVEKLDAEFMAERDRLRAQIDTKLADAVASFLTETLEHNVDLGAQSAYLVALLQEHKEDFKRELDDDALLIASSTSSPAAAPKTDKVSTNDTAR